MAAPWKVRGLQLEDKSAKAIQKILACKLHEMMSYRIRVLNSEPEGVHAMRVSARRLQTMLKLSKKFLPRKKLETFSESVKELIVDLGEVRDRDVFISNLHSSLDRTHQTIPPSAQKILNLYESQRKRAFRHLRSTLLRLEKKHFAEKFSAFLEKTL
jgi:CHAD domain-containing protein